MPISFTPISPGGNNGGTSPGGNTSETPLNPAIPIHDHPNSPPVPIDGDTSEVWVAWYDFLIAIIRNVMVDNYTPDRSYSYQGQALSRWTFPELRTELTSLQSSRHTAETGEIFISCEYY